MYRISGIAVYFSIEFLHRKKSITGNSRINPILADSKWLKVIFLTVHTLFPAMYYMPPCAAYGQYS